LCFYTIGGLGYLKKVKPCALKKKIYVEALKTSFQELQKLKFEVLQTHVKSKKG